MKPNKLQVGTIAFVASLAFAPRVQAQVDPNFYVFLAFGQSNMEGNAAVPSPAPATYARFRELPPLTCSGSGGSRTQNVWMTATSPIVRCDTKYSLLEYFGKTLVDSLPSTIRIGVVPVAVGGTPILGFMPNGVGKAYYASLAGTSSSYMLTWANEYGGDPYARLVATAKIAQQSGVIKGILLHQGETDAYKSGWADSVKTIYNSLLTDLSLKAADVPLLAGEVYNNAGQIAAIDALPKTISTAYVISSSGCPAQSDNLHFTVQGYQTLGTRYAQQMLKLLPKNTSINSGVRSGIPGLSVESSPEGISIHSDAALDRVSLRTVQGREVLAGSGNEVWILPGRVQPGLYLLRAVSQGAAETRKILVER